MALRPTVLAMMALAGIGLAACDRSPAAETAAASNPEATPTDRPVRKPGLWRQTLLVEGSPFVDGAKLCLDAEAEKVVSWWGKRGLRSDCISDEVDQKPDGSWHFSSVCVDEDHVKTTTNGSAVGDFQRRYQFTADLTTADPAHPDQSGTRSVTLDAEWLGLCPKDMRPGQLVYADGQTMNLMDLSAAVEGQ